MRLSGLCFYSEIARASKCQGRQEMAHCILMHLFSRAVTSETVLDTILQLVTLVRTLSQPGLPVHRGDGRYRPAMG